MNPYMKFGESSFKGIGTIISGLIFNNKITGVFIEHTPLITTHDAAL